MKPIAILLGLILMLTAGGCITGTEYREERPIDLSRNSDFDGTKLRLYVTLNKDSRRGLGQHRGRCHRNQFQPHAHTGAHGPAMDTREGQGR